MGNTYDIVIIGAGPAGVTAGLYAARAKLRTVILDKAKFGGKIMDIDLIENYSGFPDGVSGAKLGSDMMSQAMNQGVEFDLVEVTGIDVRNNYRVVKTATGEYAAGAIIIAGGASPKKLGVPGEDKFAGSGVGYCAVCEGGPFKGQVVAVAGGGDSGITEGLYLTRLASRVIVLEAMPKLTASKVLQERAHANAKIEIHCATRIEAIEGDTRVRCLKLLNVEKQQRSTLDVGGVFVYVGLEPDTAYLKGVVPLDDQGQILVNSRMESELPGIFAAGDIRHDSPRQIVTAVADGAVAALSAERFLTQ